MSNHPHRQGTVRSLWIAAYVVLLLSPLVLLSFAPHRGADWLHMFAIAVGFIAFTGIVLQLVTPSRLPAFTRAFGIGTLLRLHRHMGLALLVLVGLHIAVFVVHEPRFREWLWPIDGPLKAQVGWLAAAGMIAIAASSTARRLLRLSYERWRLLHIVLGLVIVVGVFAHVMLISWYASIGPVRWLSVVALALGSIALFYLRVARPYASLGTPYVVAEVVPERGGASTLRLVAARHGGAAFRPGQFAWIKVAGHAFAVTEHPFSYASSAADPARPEFTIKDLGDFTSSVSSLRPGTRVLVDGPHGAYEPALPLAGFVLVVAGIGVTPAMSFLRTARDTGDVRPYRLVYGARTLDDVTFREELDELQHYLNLEVAYVLSQPPPGWGGLTGRISPEVLVRALPPDCHLRNVFICGPEAMIDVTEAALRGLSVPGELVYADRFDSV